MLQSFSGLSLVVVIFLRTDYLFTSTSCFSERADPSYCKDRITEGANINKSLVTLGIVISALGINNVPFSFLTIAVVIALCIVRWPIMMQRQDMMV